MSIDLAAWKIPCIRSIVWGEFAFPIITPMVYLFFIRMLPFNNQHAFISFYFTIFFYFIQYILAILPLFPPDLPDFRQRNLAVPLAFYLI